MKYFLLLLFSFFFLNSNAQFNSDPTNADTIAAGNFFVNNSFLVPDGNGGVLIFWYNDPTTMQNYFINYNHLNSNGIGDWATKPNSLALASGPKFKSISQTISDGAGGAFIAWETWDSNIDPINYTSKVQHVSSSGVLLWPSDGISIAGNSSSVLICSDGSGGIIASWENNQEDPIHNLSRTYAQRISAAGMPVWGTSGVRVLNTTAFDNCFGLVADGAGGAIFSLTDTRNDVYDVVNNKTTNSDIYAQKLNSAGVADWGAQGVPVCTNANNQLSFQDQKHPYIVSDGAGGAIIGWEDYRNDANNGNSSPYNGDIYSQKINTLGVVQWAANGVIVCNDLSDQRKISMIPDGSGGAVFCWNDSRVGNNLYVQKLNSSGVAQWDNNGKKIQGVHSEAEEPEYIACADETGNYLLISWVNKDIYHTAQKISVEDGSFLWGSTGIIFYVEMLGQPTPQYALANNNAGGLIVSWTTPPVPIQYIFASRVYANGALPLNFVDFNLLPQFPDVLINWSTATETNTKIFIIQKSMDGSHFNNVTNVPASGNCNTKTNYQFKDQSALNGNISHLYYRIKETDKDGQIQYSNIKKINWSTANTFKLVSNPVSTVANMEYFSGQNSTIKIKIIDQLGKVYISTTRNILHGIHNFNLPTGNLANGLYTIQLIENGNVYQVRMVKK